MTFGLGEGFFPLNRHYRCLNWDFIVKCVILADFGRFFPDYFFRHRLQVRKWSGSVPTCPRHLFVTFLECVHDFFFDPLFLSVAEHLHLTVWVVFAHDQRLCMAVISFDNFF